MKLVRPTKSNLRTQKFGENKVSFYKEMGMLGHNGWDWYAKDGEPIYWDCLDCYGMVKELSTDINEGLGVVIISADRDGIFKHLFWHLKGFACKPGDILSTGGLIGYADNTGKSTGTHLHRGLKRVQIDKIGVYGTKDKDNGYRGGIDIKDYWKANIFVLHYVSFLKKKRFILKLLAQKFRELIQLLKGR